VNLQPCLPCRLNAVQEAIVTSAVVGAALGAAIGGAASDRWGRKPVLLAADALFALGAALMAAAPGVAVLIAGASLAAPAVAERV